MDGTRHFYRARVSDVNPVNRSVVAKINTSAIDDYGTVIDPRGMDISDYDRIVLWQHGMDKVNRGQLPVGRNAWLRSAQGPNGLPEVIAETHFYSKGQKGDEFTEQLFEMYKDGDLDGFSIDGTPDMTRCSKPTQDEIKKRPELARCSLIYRAWKLKEYSACLWPINGECRTINEARAMIRASQRGIILPDDILAQVKLLEEQEATILEQVPELPTLGGRSYSEAQAEMLVRVQGLFDPAKLEDQLKMEREWRQGIV